MIIENIICKYLDYSYSYYYTLFPIHIDLANRLNTPLCIDKVLSFRFYIHVLLRCILRASCQTSELLRNDPIGRYLSYCCVHSPISRDQWSLQIAECLHLGTCLRANFKTWYIDEKLFSFPRIILRIVDLRFINDASLIRCSSMISLDTT